MSAKTVIRECLRRPANRRACGASLRSAVDEERVGNQCLTRRQRSARSGINDTPGSKPTKEMNERMPARWPIFITVFFLALFNARTSAAEPTWKAGVAKAIITPEKPVWLAGYGTKRPPDGKLHELWMKALALEDDAGQRAVLITSDFQGVPRSMSDRVFAQLREKFGLERRQVLLTFSHNHCGPRLGDDLVDYYPVEAEQEKLVNEYTDQMIGRMVA